MAVGSILAFVAALAATPAGAQTLGPTSNGYDLQPGINYVINGGTTITRSDGTSVLWQGIGEPDTPGDDIDISSIVNNGTVSRGATGAIPDRQAIYIDGHVATLTNNGIIESLGLQGSAIVATRGITTFVNTGTIFSGDEIGVIYNRGTRGGGTLSSGTFNNSGLISGYYTGVALAGEHTTTMVNSGIIEGRSTDDGSGSSGMWVTNGTVNNSGRISGANTTAVATGAGIVARSYFAGGLVVINSGTISGLSGPNGTAGRAIDFGYVEPRCDTTIHSTFGLPAYTGGDDQGCDVNNPNTNKPGVARDDVLRLLPGSQIYGAVIFGKSTGAGDLIDLQAYTGTMTLPIAYVNKLYLRPSDGVSNQRDLDTFTSMQVGTTGYVYKASPGTIVINHDDAKTGTLAVINLSAVGGGGGSGGGGATTGGVTTEISNVVAAQVGDISQSTFGTLDTGGSSVDGTTGGSTEANGNVSNYAESSKPTAAEVAAAQMAGLKRGAPGRKSWVSGFGGVSANQNGTPFSSLFGGVIAGTQAEQSAATTLGVFGGYVRSNLYVSGNAQTVGTHSAIAGFYGQTALGVLTASYTIIGGLNFNHSERSVSGDLAKADYLGWFLAPEASLSVPVWKDDDTTVNFALKAKYVGGSIAGYSESGSVAPITVGGQPVSLAEGRLELNGTQTIGKAADGPISFFGKAGVYAQSNLGGSSVPVTVFGTTFTSITPGAVNYGVYGGAGVKMPLNPASDFSLSFNGSGQSDGLLNAAGKIQLLTKY